MLDQEQIKALLQKLNDKLKEKNEFGEVGIVGGAIMCLVYQTRHATKDIDAVFEPAQLIRKMILEIADELNISPHWMNDAVKGYLQHSFQRQNILELSHLRVWAPEPKYMLAMKCISARYDTHDQDDVKFLIAMLALKSSQDVFKVIESFYPKKQIPIKTQYFIDEVFEEKNYSEIKERQEHKKIS